MLGFFFPIVDFDDTDLFSINDKVCGLPARAGFKLIAGICSDQILQMGYYGIRMRRLSTSSSKSLDV
jgi:hypothetical protein